ncbi:MAG TPA: PD-(D/E)XK nuclease family protein [Gemmatimonadales bacterium]|nr:PD-(D/E)XK nuclease family protein [Gemmatimonadales bacterium]
MPESPTSAAVRLVLATDPRLLLERAAEEHLRPPVPRDDGTFPTPGCLLALRQGGLRDDLLALARTRGVAGWLDPAIAVFHELPRWLGATERRPCDDFERAVILGGALRRLGGEVFGRLNRPEAFLRALDRLVGELAAEGVTPDAFRRALESRRGRDEFEKARDHELAHLYQDYVDTLARHGLRDGRDTWLDCATALASDPAALARRLGGRREIRLVGLADLRGGWRPLLRALASSPTLDRIVIYSSEPLDLGDLPVTVERLEEPETAATRLFRVEPAAGAPTTDAPTTDAPATGPEIHGIDAPDVERELEEVARRVRALVDAGVPPTEIAVVARQARPYLDLAISALEKFGLPVTARRRIGLREIPAIRAVRALLAAAAGNWERHGLVELAEQPYVAAELDAQVINFAGFRRRIAGLGQWERALRELATEAEAHERRDESEREERRAQLPPASRALDAARGMAAFAARAKALDGTRPLSGWVQWLAGFLQEDPWRVKERILQVPAGRFDVVRVDLAGWRALAAIVERWREALDAWGGANDPIDVARFREQLDELLDGDAALWTETMRGVRVLEGLAAAYRSFEHVFVVGLQAGSFPLRAPGSPLLDEAERRELAGAGLPFEPREVWDGRERELFRALAASARRSLTVSYARLDASGREVVRSGFVERLAEAAGSGAAWEGETLPSARVVTPGCRLYRGDEAARRARHAVRIERLRARGEISPYNGLIEDPALVAWLAEEFGDDRLWSPTQLEAFAKCPWAYFGERLLGVAKLEDPDEDMDHATRGSLLHDALRRFFGKAKDKVGGPVFLRAADRDWARPMMEQALDEALADAGGRKWLGHPALQPAKRLELARMLLGYLESEIQEHEDMYDSRKRNAPRMVRTGVSEHERGFTDLVLERHGVRFRFRGSVDRVEVGVDERFESAGYLAAVDYKTTKSSAPGGGDTAAWDDHVVLQVPLYAYALTRLYPGATITRVEYRAIKHREPVHRLELHQVSQGGPVEREEARRKMERALDMVALHVLRVRKGEFPTEPAESCGCPDFCASREICRVPGGPRKKGRG